MKRFNVLHQTTYNYTEQVHLAPHVLRLRPREDHDQRIMSSNLSINPEASLRWHRDAESNSVAIATFSEPVNCLQIECVTVIQKYDVSPQDFLLADYAVTYPFTYLPDDCITLYPYLNSNKIATEPALKLWIDTVWAQDKPISTFELLLLFNQQIYNAIQYTIREEEGVQSTYTTLHTRAGSCRDLASLYIDAVRHLGFAARFVSGYVYTESQSGEPGTTHAWAEVFIPGAGWKGFDPTHGCLVGASHIRVAVASRPDQIPPVSGAFWGLPGSMLTVKVWVSEISDS